MDDAPLRCDRCGLDRRSLAFRSYEGVPAILCLECRLEVAAIDQESAP